MADIKTLQITNAGEDVEKGNIKLLVGMQIVIAYVEGLEFICKTENEITYNQKFTASIYLEKTKTLI